MTAIYGIMREMIKVSSLFRNSIYLMASTAIMAGFGFVFWLINSRLYSPEQVGIGTTLVSVSALISGFSLFGLNNALIKYLPTSRHRNEKVNTSFTIVGAVSILMSVLFIVFVKIFSPSLTFINKNVLMSVLFILIISFSSLNALVDNVFIAYRSAIYVLIKSAVQSVLKVALPFIFISAGAYGIFITFGAASAFAFLFCVIVLLMKFGFTVRPQIHLFSIRTITKFSVSSYTAEFIGRLPSLLLPIFIINGIGAEHSAYFYIDLMIANLLFTIPFDTAQSLFAEGSYGETGLQEHIKKAAILISILLIPAAIVIFVLGNYILLAFGSRYVSGGFVLLRLLTISMVFGSVGAVGEAILKIRHKMKLLITVNMVYTAVILITGLLLIKSGLTGIGIGILAGNIVSCVLYLFIFSQINKTAQ